MLKERKRLRLKDFDYSSDNAYFITICTKNSDYWFGYIKNGIMNLNQFGKIVEKCWYDLPKYYKNCVLDEFVIMPNHIHGIIIIDNELIAEEDIAGEGLKPSRTDDGLQEIKIHGSPEMVKSLKSFSSRGINELIAEEDIAGEGLKPSRTDDGLQKIKIEIPKYQWHRSFHEIIIRDEKAYINIKNYIKNNPINWDNDKNNKKSNINYAEIFFH